MTTASDGDVEHEAIARARWRLGGLAVALAFVGMALLVAVALNAKDLGGRIDDLGLLAIPVLVVAGALLVAAMVPVTLVAAAAGYAFGTAGGTPVALVAASAGAMLCAAVGRYAGTPAARLAFGQRAARCVTWIDGRPIRSVVTFRLLPGLPFSASSYALGFTRIRLRDIGAGTAVGFAPRCFAYVALGGSLRDLSSPEAQVALAASVALAVLVAVAPRLLLRAPHSDSTRQETPYG